MNQVSNKKRTGGIIGWTRLFSMIKDAVSYEKGNGIKGERLRFHMRKDPVSYEKGTGFI